MGFAEMLTIIFVIMKLLGFIDWSWWLVWLPEIIVGSHPCNDTIHHYMGESLQRDKGNG